jgi:tetratricopeptide (TPR) repeat protein
MTAVDLHPEDLLDKLHARRLSELERARLDEHLRGCEACSFEIAVAGDLDDEEHPIEDADALVLGAIGRSAAKRRISWWLPALAAALVAGSAAAQWIAGAPPSGVAMADGSAEAPPAEVKVLDQRSAPPALGDAPPADPILDAPPASAPIAVDPGDGERPSAATLFQRGNEARRAGRRDEALRFYRILQQRFPSSPEAQLSLQMAARMELDDAPHRALEGYDRYLDEEGRLGEEALVGRATALARLGRDAEEAAMWRELLALHPRSIHAARARARLAEIEGAR